MHSAYLLLLPATLATPVADPDPIFVPFHPILAPQIQHPKFQFHPLFGPGFPFNHRIQPPQQSKQNPVLVIHTLVQNPNQRLFGGNQLQNLDSFDKSLFGALFQGESSLFGKIFGGGGIDPANSLLVPSRSLPGLATTPSTIEDVISTTPRIIQLYPERSKRPNEKDNDQTGQSDEDDSDEDDSDRDDSDDDDEDSEKDSADPKTEDANVPHIELLQ